MQGEEMLLFAELAKEYENALAAHSPELGLLCGKSNVALDRFMDYSMAGHNRWLQQEDDFLLRLDEINNKDMQDSAQYSTYMLLKEHLASKIASRICRSELWDINPLYGWHNIMVNIAEKQPVGTDVYRKLAIDRWQTFDKVVASQIDNLQLGLKLGYTAPKPAVNRVLEQINTILACSTEDSPYFDFALRDGDKQFKRRVVFIIQTIINPSLKKYASYLDMEYMPLARNEIGISSLPSGVQCYEAKLNEATTLKLTPHEIHTLGLNAIHLLEQEVGEIGLKKYGILVMADIFNAAANESKGYFSTEKDILNYNFAALKRVQDKINDWFDPIPKMQANIHPYPDYRAKTGAIGEYLPQNEDGSTAGVFYINTWRPKQQSRIDQEAKLFHELIPGHHLQIALACESKTVPTLNRYLSNAGFTEGWGLYAERLADEMGVYLDDISRLGMLANEALRASRLVVDTGIHAFNWSRELAIDYLKQHTVLSDYMIAGEIDRYIMMPGQATAYLLGKNEIKNLRQLAINHLGDSFDIRQFHHQVLKNGFVSLAVLKSHIKNWLLTFKKDIGHDL